MKEQLGTNGTLHIFSRRELENYLLSPRPLAALIGSKRVAGGFGSSAEVKAEEVGKELQKAANQLRPLTVIKRATKEILGSMHPKLEWDISDTTQTAPEKIVAEINRIRGELAAQEAAATQVLANTEKAVTASWANQWFMLAPGDELLDVTCKAFSVRFRKTTDGPALSKLYRSEEIETELRELIHNLVK